MKEKERGKTTYLQLFLDDLPEPVPIDLVPLETRDLQEVLLQVHVPAGGLARPHPTGRRVESLLQPLDDALLARCLLLPLASLLVEERQERRHLGIVIDHLENEVVVVVVVWGLEVLDGVGLAGFHTLAEFDDRPPHPRRQEREARSVPVVAGLMQFASLFETAAPEISKLSDCQCGRLATSRVRLTVCYHQR